MTVWEKSNLPGPHGANTCGTSHVNPRVSRPGMKAPPALHIVLRGSGFGLQHRKLCKELWGFELHLNKHWPKSQATATKRANIQTQTNNYFSDFVSFVLICQGIWILGIPWPWWGEGHPESWRSTRWKLRRRNTPVVCDRLPSFSCLQSVVAKNSSNSLCLLNMYKQARNCDESFTQSQPSGTFLEYTEQMINVSL